MGIYAGVFCVSPQFWSIYPSFFGCKIIIWNKGILTYGMRLLIVLIHCLICSFYFGGDLCWSALYLDNFMVCSAHRCAQISPLYGQWAQSHKIDCAAKNYGYHCVLHTIEDLFVFHPNFDPYIPQFLFPKQLFEIVEFLLVVGDCRSLWYIVWYVVLFWWEFMRELMWLISHGGFQSS